MYFLVKTLVSAVLIAVISEVAKRNPSAGALIASLPLVSIIAIIWLWRDTADIERVASHAQATFWYVLPSLPMFLLFPALLRAGIGFWQALGAACVLTITLYAITIVIAGKFGVRL